MKPVHIVTAALATLLIAAEAQIAVGQDNARCPSCRAMAHFRTCEKPLDGKVLVRGKVIGVENALCSQVISLEVERSSEIGLRPHIGIDLGYCAFWAGAVGDVIDVAMAEPSTADRNMYSLACRLW